MLTFLKNVDIKHIEPGDVLLVDKGFTVQDLLLSSDWERGTVLLQKKSTWQIAKARIHVELFNERLKKFKLVSRIIPQSLNPVAAQMVYVACCLVNFQSSLCI